MELIERITDLQSSAESQLQALDTRKKTENALILPFFRALGYDPFNVLEVEPDFDVGLKEQGMKTVDYALKKGGTPVMFFQCEEAGTDLGAYDNSFLFQYFDVLEADVAVFTNGLAYQFYANLDAGVDVDGHPFFGFDLLDHEPEQIEELKRFTKSLFDSEEVLSVAYDRKCSRLLRRYFVRQQQAPDEALVRFLATQLYGGEVSDKVIERFRPVVQMVIEESVDDENESLLQVPHRANESGRAAKEAGPPESDGPRSLETEEEEIELEPTTPDKNPSTNGEEERDVDDPFEKDLARRVIDSF